MTDERMGAALWPALLCMPAGGGVVFRHLATPARERRAIFVKVRRIARARGLALVVAGEPLPGAGRFGGPRALAWPAHDRREAVAGVRAGARYLFVSPVFATRTHPGARALGARRAMAVGRGLPVARIALGGMSAAKWRRLRGFDGWAAIDAWV
jgi:thiamine-phosphate pyrophosphorylase